MRIQNTSLSQTFIAHIACLCALIISTTPLPLLPFLPMPSWGLILIFYYSMRSPQSLSPFILAVYGLLYDVVFDAPLGTHACFFPLCTLFLTHRRERFKGRRTSDYWQHFIVMLTLYSVYIWIFYTLANRQSCITLQLFNQYVMSIIAYPLIHAAFTPARPSPILRP